MPKVGLIIEIDREDLKSLAKAAIDAEKSRKVFLEMLLIEIARNPKMLRDCVKLIKDDL